MPQGARHLGKWLLVDLPLGSLDRHSFSNGNLPVDQPRG